MAFLMAKVTRDAGCPSSREKRIGAGIRPAKIFNNWPCVVSCEVLGGEVSGEMYPLIHWSIIIFPINSHLGGILVCFDGR